MTAPTTARRRVPGAELHHEVRGSGPLLLVIGQPMTSEPFAPLAELLAADHTVVTYDPRGMGRSTVDDATLDVTPEVEADDLAHLVEAHGGGPADVFASSGGAVAGLALVARHPGLVRTLVAHEPPVTELLPDAPHVRAVVDGIVEAYRRDGGGAAWGAFVSLVVHDGPVGPEGVPPAAWPPAGAPAPGTEPGTEPGTGSEDGGAGDTGATGGEPSPEERRRQDGLFFLRMLVPFTRWVPPVEQLRAHDGAVVVAVGATSRQEAARRSAEALAERLGVAPVAFPGDHGGFMADPRAFADRLREVLDRAR